MGVEAILYRNPVRLSASRRLVIHGAGLGLWLTGVLWLVFHYFLQRRTEFGPQPHPLEIWWRAAHGFFGFASLWTFGLVWGVHIVGAWKSRRRRLSGSMFFALLLWLSGTGYLLYYVGGDDAVAALSLMHWIVGLFLPVAFVAHRFRFAPLPLKSRRYP